MDKGKTSAQREYLCERGLEEAVVLDPVSLDKAIIGISEEANGGRVIYSYEKLVKAFMETEGWSEEEAIEWIDYNTLRALPYMGASAPIIVMDEMQFQFLNEE